MRIPDRGKQTAAGVGAMRDLPDVEEEATHPREGRRRSPGILFGAGLLLIAGVGAWQLNATLWTSHSERVGKALVHGFLNNHALVSPVRRSAAASGLELASCSGAQSGSQGSTPVEGLLEIPKLGVVAPVEQGISDTQLAVAVGHDPYSVWPGTKGNAVLEAHDVSYFTSIAKLRAGDVVRYVTPCTTYLFTVTSHAVVSQGSPVYNTSVRSVTLVTCWPTDALWFTTDRYLVTATEVTKEPTGSSINEYVAVTPPPTVPVPGALSSQGVTLATYALPMGTFSLSGRPDPAWSQTTSPLLIEASAVRAFIAGVKALTEGQILWWNDVAPHVPPVKELNGAENPDYLTSTSVTEHADGDSVTSVTLRDTVAVSGGSEPGRYSMTVVESVHNGSLTISSWTMVPA